MAPCWHESARTDNVSARPYAGSVLSRLEGVVDGLRDDLAVLDQVGVDSVTHSYGRVLVRPFEKPDRPLRRDVRVVERGVLRQLFGEHPRQLPHALIAMERAAIDQDDDVLGYVATQILFKDLLERQVNPLIGNVEMIVQYVPSGTATQVVHRRDHPSGSRERSHIKCGRPCPAARTECTIN